MKRRVCCIVAAVCLFTGLFAPVKVATAMPTQPAATSLGSVVTAATPLAPTTSTPCGFTGMSKIGGASIAKGAVTVKVYYDGDRVCYIIKKRSLGNVRKMTLRIQYQPMRSSSRDFTRSTIGAGMKVVAWTQPPQWVIATMVYRGKTYHVHTRQVLV